MELLVSFTLDNLFNLNPLACYPLASVPHAEKEQCTRDGIGASAVDRRVSGDLWKRERE